MKKNILYIVCILSFVLFLTDCTRHRRRDVNSPSSGNNVRTEQTQSRERKSSGGKSVVKMKKSDGVYFVPCKINGTEMEFIFDTGASDITMSLTEAVFLYKQGKLKKDDFIGTQHYQIADGSIQEGAIVVLRTVQIGNRTMKNIQASIIDNFDAPLLLGQSALSKFGKISIDYNLNEITFE